MLEGWHINKGFMWPYVLTAYLQAPACDLDWRGGPQAGEQLATAANERLDDVAASYPVLVRPPGRWQQRCV